jgi:hypothetical protein
VEAREAGQALRASRGVVGDHAPDPLGRARRILGPAGVLEQHGLHGQSEAPRGPVEELAEPRPIGLVHEEAWAVLDAEIEAVGEGGEPRELRVPLLGRPPLGAVDPDRDAPRVGRRGDARRGHRRAGHREAEQGQRRDERAGGERHDEVLQSGGERGGDGR